MTAEATIETRLAAQRSSIRIEYELILEYLCAAASEVQALGDVHARTCAEAGGLAVMFDLVITCN